MAIALELLSPEADTLQKSWIFEAESVIRIGRAIDNQIILSNNAVSDYHTMLWGEGEDWKLVNLSCNGTYLDQKPITHALVKQGAIIRLAISGPQIRCRYLASNTQSAQRPEPAPKELRAPIKPLALSQSMPKLIH